jgi:hypothetical protein
LGTTLAGFALAVVWEAAVFDEPNDRFGVGKARRALDEITRSVLLGRMDLVQVRAGAAVSLMESMRLMARTDQLLARRWV